jgi:hypothetical protein
VEGANTDILRSILVRRSRFGGERCTDPFSVRGYPSQAWFEPEPLPTLRRASSATGGGGDLVAGGWWLVAGGWWLVAGWELASLLSCQP